MRTKNISSYRANTRFAPYGTTFFRRGDACHRPAICGFYSWTNPKDFVNLLEQAFSAKIPTDLTPLPAPRDSAFAEWQNTILGYASGFAEIKDLPQDDPFLFHGFANPDPRQFVEYGIGEVSEDVTWEDFINLLENERYYE